VITENLVSGYTGDHCELG